MEGTQRQVVLAPTSAKVKTLLAHDFCRLHLHVSNHAFQASSTLRRCITANGNGMRASETERLPCVRRSDP